MRILQILSMILMIGCTSTNKLIVKSGQNNTVDETLLSEISSYIDRMNNFYKTGIFSESKIFTVNISTDGNDCFVIIGTMDYYDSDLMKGYIFLKNKLVVFYESANSCDFNLVNYNNLKKNNLKGYSDQYSEESKHIYDPFVRKYKVINKQVLELVYEGFY